MANVSTYSILSFLAHLFLLLKKTSLAGTYNVSIEKETDEKFGWKEVNVSIFDQNHHKNIKNSMLSNMSIRSSADLISKPVYVSLTTMHNRIASVHHTIITLLAGIVAPTKIYLLISKESFLLDRGVKKIPLKLLCLSAENLLTIVYTRNIGPHRKLLPLLHKNYENDVLIVNVDDDMKLMMNSSLLYQLLISYIKTEGKSVIALRARRIGICGYPPYGTIKYKTWPLLFKPEATEMLLLPTGTGGVLYRPKFFHPIIFSKKFRLITGLGDDIMFRFSCFLKNIPVTIACRDLIIDRVTVIRCPISTDFIRPTNDNITSLGLGLDFSKEKIEEFIKEADELHLLTGNFKENYVLATELTNFLDKVNNGLSNASSFNKYNVNLSIKNEGNNIFDYLSVDKNKNNGKIIIINDTTILNEEKRKLTSSLFAINKQGTNDIQVSYAIIFLKHYGYFDFSKFVKKYRKERGEECYDIEKYGLNDDLCSIGNCTKIDSYKVVKKGEKKFVHIMDTSEKE